MVIVSVSRKEISTKKMLEATLNRCYLRILGMAREKKHTTQHNIAAAAEGKTMYMYIGCGLIETMLYWMHAGIIHKESRVTTATGERSLDAEIF